MGEIYTKAPCYFVDRTSAMPAYQQIATSMINRISDKEWLVGDRLPSECDLAAAYGVSRVTLRQALSQLEGDGIIEKFRGKGIYVSRNPQHVVQNLEFPSLEPKRAASPIDYKIVRIWQGAAPNHNVIYHLNAAEEESITHLQRLFLHENRPIGLNNVWFRTAVVPDLAETPFVDGSLSSTLRCHYGIHVVRIENDIECVRLDAVSAELLQTSYDALALKINSQYFSDANLPVQYSSTFWLADYTQFHYTAKKE